MGRNSVAGNVSDVGVGTAEGLPDSVSVSAECSAAGGVDSGSLLPVHVQSTVGTAVAQQIAVVGEGLNSLGGVDGSGSGSLIEEISTEGVHVSGELGNSSVSQTTADETDNAVGGIMQLSGSSSQLVQALGNFDAGSLQQVGTIVHNLTLGHQGHAVVLAVVGASLCIAVQSGGDEVVLLEVGVSQNVGNLCQVTVLDELLNFLQGTAHKYVDVLTAGSELNVQLGGQLVLGIGLKLNLNAGSIGELLQLGLDSVGPVVAGQNHADGSTSIGLVSVGLGRGGLFFCGFGTVAAASHQGQGHQQAQNQSEKSFHRGFLLLFQKNSIVVWTQDEQGTP